MFWKLVILAVLVVILRPIIGLIMRLLLRAIFRRGLEWVGSRALDQQPDHIHLTPHAGDDWKDPVAVEALAAPLTVHGFREAGAYSIQEMAGVAVRFLIQPEQRIVACVYEHPQAGAWIDLVCSQSDATGITYSTLRPTGMESRPGNRKVNAPELSSDALYQRLLQERPAAEWEEWTAANAATKFEDAYARETAWRRNKGVSAEEVARQIPQMAPNEAYATTE